MFGSMETTDHMHGFIFREDCIYGNRATPTSSEVFSTILTGNFYKFILLKV